MQILKQSCGSYQTNCYIVCKNGFELIIDPGVGAYHFATQNTKNPIAIINTHGHFDHVFDNYSLKNLFNIDVFIHKDDKFMLESDFCNAGYELVFDAKSIGGEKFSNTKIDIGEFEVEFMHFAGHTPGCCMVRVDDIIFSGDFLFSGSIGRYDFPYSNKFDMIKSLQKCLKIQGDFTLYPGHGHPTTLKVEQKNLPFWLKQLEDDF